MFSTEAYWVLGNAYSDATGDGTLDPTDPPLQGAVLVVKLTDGTERRVRTDVKGEAKVILTEGTNIDPDPRCRELTPDVLAVTMEPPRGYELIWSKGYQFLFRKTTGGSDQ